MEASDIVGFVVLFIPVIIQGIEVNETSLSDFETIVKQPIFLDKTLLIKEFLTNKNKLIQITAPDGFGKSTNVNMLKRFLEIKTDKNGGRLNKTTTTDYKLFKRYNLHIVQDEQFFNEHLGKYPVIHINYEPLLKTKSYKEAINELRKIVYKSFLPHYYLLYIGSFWKDLDIKEFKYYVMYKKLNLKYSKIVSAFEYLSLLLEKFYGEKVIVFIEKYDAFVYDLIFQKILGIEKILALMFTINDKLLTSEHVQKALITGVLRLGTGFYPNTTKEYNFLNNHRFGKFYGISENELNRILSDEKEQEATRNSIDQYYGGYSVVKKYNKIYNIDTTLKFLRNRKLGSICEENGVFEKVCRVQRVSYWIKLLLLGYYINLDISKPLSKDDILALNNLCISLKVKDTEDVSLFMHVFYSKGYLVVVDDATGNVNYTRAYLTIPNQGIFSDFSKLLEAS